MRKFTVRRCSEAHWHWECTMCQPPAKGCCRDWARVITRSLPHHLRVRHYHHQWVAEHA